MALTNPILPWLLSALSVLAFVFVVLSWAKFSNRNGKAIFGRIALLLVTNIFFMMSIGVFLNNYGDFYSSWSELLGRKTQAPVIFDRSSSVLTKADLANATITNGGSAIFHRMVHGPVSGISAEVIISIPPSYVQALQTGSTPKTNYRVIEYLPGYPGHPMAWIHGMKIIDMQDQEHKARQMPEVIAVLPRINVFKNIDAECMNLPKGPQIESWITKDVYSFANKWLAITPSKWGIAGYSTGGWCSAMLVLRHPDQYSMGAAIAGYFSPQVAKQVTGAERISVKKEYNITNILENNPPPVSFFVINSLDDKLSHNSTVGFLGKLRSPIVSTEVVLKGQGHNFASWKQVIPPMLDWFGIQLRDPSRQ